mgnify:CR=1 FL=1
MRITRRSVGESLPPASVNPHLPREPSLSGCCLHFRSFWNGDAVCLWVLCAILSLRWVEFGGCFVRAFECGGCFFRSLEDVGLSPSFTRKSGTLTPTHSNDCDTHPHTLKTMGHSHTITDHAHRNMSNDTPRGPQEEDNQTHNEEKRELRVKMGDTEQVLELRIFSPSNVHYKLHRNIIRRRKNSSFTSN